MIHFPVLWGMFENFHNRVLKTPSVHFSSGETFLMSGFQAAPPLEIISDGPQEVKDVPRYFVTRTFIMIFPNISKNLEMAQVPSVRELVTSIIWYPQNGWPNNHIVEFMQKYLLMRKSFTTGP